MSTPTTSVPASRPTVPGDFVGYSELSFPSTTSERSALWAFDEISLASAGC